MQLKASGALKTRQESQKLWSFSKMWKVNDRAVVYYPIIRDPETGELDLLVAAVYGHQIDMQNFGVRATFIPTHSELSESGDVLKPDALYKFSQIARLFIDGEKERRLHDLEKQDWSGIPKSTYNQEVRKIEDEYDTKNNIKAKGPVVKRLAMLITTECLYVPVNGDKPDASEARVVAQPLSNVRIAKILDAIRNSDTHPADDENWVEVKYSFVSASNNKMEAGKADPVGTNPEYRIKARYPDAFAELQSHLANLPKESSTIERRNYSYREIPEPDIMQAIQSYCIMNAQNLAELPSESEEILLRNAKLLYDLRVPLTNFSDEQRTKLEQAAGVPQVPAQVPSYAPEQQATPTLAGLMQHELRAPDELTEAIDNGESVDL